MSLLKIISNNLYRANNEQASLNPKLGKIDLSTAANPSKKQSPNQNSSAFFINIDEIPEPKKLLMESTISSISGDIVISSKTNPEK